MADPTCFLSAATEIDISCYHIIIIVLQAPENQWHHVVLSYNGSSATIYMDNNATYMGAVTGGLPHLYQVVSTNKVYYTIQQNY